MSYEPFTVVLHKSLNGEVMVVLPKDDKIKSEFVEVRRAKQSQNGTTFVVEAFYAEELETPEQSIEREAELFRKITTKKQELVSNVQKADYNVN